MARIIELLRAWGLLTLFICLLIASVTAGAAQSSRIQLELHGSQLISLPEDVHQLKIDNEYVAALLADKRDVFVQARGLGRTRLQLFDKQAVLVKEYQVQVHANLEPLRALLKAALPGEPLKVEQLQDRLLLSGTISSEQSREQILSLVENFLRPEIDRPGGNFTTVVDQLQLSDKAALQLQVMIAEIPKHLISQLGADYVAVDDRVQAAESGVVGDQQAVRTYRQQLLHSQIRAEEARGHIRLLATADLDLRSGEAVFLRAGGAFPLPSALRAVAQPIVETEAPQYRRFVLRPRFLPHLREDGQISLQADFEVSALSLTDEKGELRKMALGPFAPLDQVRTISRQVEMLPGQTIAFSGLLEEELGGLSGQIPGLSELPVIGRLFDSQAYREGYSDLVLLVSASLPPPVMPLSPQPQPQPARIGALYLLGHDWQPMPGRDLALPLAPLPQPVKRAAAQGAVGSYGHVIN